MARRTISGKRRGVNKNSKGVLAVWDSFTNQNLKCLFPINSGCAKSARKFFLKKNDVTIDITSTMCYIYVIR